MHERWTQDLQRARLTNPARRAATLCGSSPDPASAGSAGTRPSGVRSQMRFCSQGVHILHPIFKRVHKGHDTKPKTKGLNLLAGLGVDTQLRFLERGPDFANGCKASRGAAVRHAFHLTPLWSAKTGPAGSTGSNPTGASAATSPHRGAAGISPDCRQCPAPPAPPAKRKVPPPPQFYGPLGIPRPGAPAGRYLPA